MIWTPGFETLSAGFGSFAGTREARSLSLLRYIVNIWPVLMCTSCTLYAAYAHTYSIEPTWTMYMSVRTTRQCVRRVGLRLQAARRPTVGRRPRRRHRGSMFFGADLWDALEEEDWICQSSHGSTSPNHSGKRFLNLCSMFQHFEQISFGSTNIRLYCGNFRPQNTHFFPLKVDYGDAWFCQFSHTWSRQIW